jgi:beta-phosphoglucomutase-like phosphatase (HAD superfamily)
MHWRGALDAAQDALTDVSRSPSALQLPAVELRHRARALAHEREETEYDLEQLAVASHERLHRHLTGPRAAAALLGLEPSVAACVFDLDGVLTASAPLHAAAWQETFDELLARHHRLTHERFGPWRPFARREEYARYIHGRPRLEGVHGFLASRGISLPDGNPDDRPGLETAWGLANRKNEVLRRRLDHEGVRGYEGSLWFLELACEAGIRCAVVSASANTGAILRRAGLAALVDVVVDGTAIAEEHLRWKPAADTILTACRRLGVSPSSTATFETTVDGVAAGRALGLAELIGVERDGRAPALAAAGANRIVSDLAELIDPILG